MKIYTKVPHETLKPIGRGLFVCSKCQRRHSRTRADGSPQSYCRRCHAAYMRERRELQRGGETIEISIVLHRPKKPSVSIYNQTISARSFLFSDDHDKKVLD